MAELKPKPKRKKPNPFNRLPINPPKGWRETYTLPAAQFRVIPK